MAELRKTRLEDAHEVPWKNGLGRTRELALWPLHASLALADFDWRISRATVAEPGPFSVVPGLERILVVTRGDGLVLSHGEAAPTARLERLEPYRFAGAWPTEADLPQGPVQDFNVMFAPDRVRASVEVLTPGRHLAATLPGGQAFLHVLEGALEVHLASNEGNYELAAGDSLWLRELGGGEQLGVAARTPDLEALLVRLEPVASDDIAAQG